MRGTSHKNGWVLLLVVLSGIVLGGFLGQLAVKVPYLHWLSYGQTFGFEKPFVLNLGVLVITFGLKIAINIASIIGLIIGIILYRLL